MLLSASAAVIVGFALLIWGADRFVIGASATARNLGVSPLIIGLTIVGFGTSAPEMLVSGIAAYTGNPSMGVGNAIGSNITNVGLVLGITALVTPLTVHSDTLRREFPTLLFIMVVTYFLLLDGDLGYFDGIVLLTGMVLMIIWAVSLGMSKKDDDPLIAEFDEEIPKEMSTAVAVFWLFIGIVILLVSSRLLVWGATDIAKYFGVSDLIIGLTVIAIGTSLPELAASVMSAIKGEHDLAIGNILGSNMFNLLAVLGIPGIIMPHQFETAVLTRDYPIMTVLTVFLLIFAFGMRGHGKVNRIEGGLLLGGYIGYMGLLYYSMTQ